MPTLTPYAFQEQCESTAPMDCPIATGIHNKSIQDHEVSLSQQELVVSAEGDSVIKNIKQIIEEKTNEIQQLKIQISQLQDEAELREEQYQVDIAKKNREIKSLKEYYAAQLADKDRELQEARDEAEGLKQSNEEREKKLKDELTQTKEKYEMELQTLKEAKEVECLKLRLSHTEETKKLELQIKDLQCQLADKKATIADLEKVQMQQQLEETRRESKRQLEEKQREISKLQERLQLHSGTGDQQPQLQTTIASNGHNINISTDALQPITAGTANLTLVPPDVSSNSQTLVEILKNGSSLTKKK